MWGVTNRRMVSYLYRSLQLKIDQVKVLVSKIDQVKECVWKSDQLLFSYIAVDRFFRRTPSLDRFLKHTVPLDRFFFGWIDMVPATILSAASLPVNSSGKGIWKKNVSSTWTGPAPFHSFFVSNADKLFSLIRSAFWDLINTLFFVVFFSFHFRKIVPYNDYFHSSPPPPKKENPLTWKNVLNNSRITFGRQT